MNTDNGSSTDVDKRTMKRFFPSRFSNIISRIPSKCNSICYLPLLSQAYVSHPFFVIFWEVLQGKAKDFYWLMMSSKLAILLHSIYRSVSDRLLTLCLFLNLKSDRNMFEDCDGLGMKVPPLYY